MKLQFKKWLEAGDNWGMEPPVQNPTLLTVGPSSGAFPRYEVPPKDQPRMKKMKKQSK